ncbi:MAG: amidohydrolase [Clostridia bacterium]|nr:amidohydrolase [Clostridia bacterium]
MEKLIKAVEKHTDLILKSERWLWAHPETGYKEYETAKYMTEKFTELGYDLVQAGDIPGFYTVIDTGRPGPTLLILAELDSIICFGHKECNPKTGAVHSCGHHAQSAALIGIAAALKEPGVLDGLSGKIKLCSVPAEELLEIEFRNELRKKGVIKYMGGKSEFLYRGYFDDVDLAFMVHTSVGETFASSLGANGCIAKKIIFKGVASHAGGSPWNGKNALYAATCGINACNALRETFKDADQIRFHPIITSGGAMVNAIPETVTAESYVRGKTFESILEANKRINQALIGGAMSINCNVELVDIPGYAPLVNSPDMIKAYQEACSIGVPEYGYVHREVYSGGSTDMGDLSCIMPTIHPNAPGAQGTSHGSDYYLVDPMKACVGSAKVQLVMLSLLLKDDAKRAKEIIANFEPRFKSKKEFLDYCDAIFAEGDRIIYEDGKATVKL